MSLANAVVRSFWSWQCLSRAGLVEHEALFQVGSSGRGPHCIQTWHLRGGPCVWQAAWGPVPGGCNCGSSCIAVYHCSALKLAVPSKPAKPPHTTSSMA